MTELPEHELLELAAKAAELPECGWMGPAFMYVKNNTFTEWNPLTYDGDALRLAVKLGIDVCFGANYVIARGSVQMPTVNNSNDPYAATRRAIVIAAADIGKGIKQPTHSDWPEDNYYKTQAEAFEKGME